MDERDEADPKLVWRVCPYIRDEDCNHCSPTYTVRDIEGCVRACYALASEVVNIVQTGNERRKRETTNG